MLGVDFVVPDLTYLRRNPAPVHGIVLTHAHEDHIGALPFLLKEVDAPVYGTAFTLGLVRQKLQELGRRRPLRAARGLARAADSSGRPHAGFHPRGAQRRGRGRHRPGHPRGPGRAHRGLQDQPGRWGPGHGRGEIRPLRGARRAGAAVGLHQRRTPRGDLPRHADRRYAHPHRRAQPGPGHRGALRLQHRSHPDHRRHRARRRAQGDHHRAQHRGELRDRADPRLPHPAERDRRQHRPGRGLPGRGGRHRHHRQPGRADVGLGAHGLGDPQADPDPPRRYRRPVVEVDPRQRAGDHARSSTTCTAAGRT